MANKVIDLNPHTRLTKESLNRIKGVLDNIEPGDVDNLVLLYTTKEGKVTFDATGVDWSLLGIMQAYLEDLRKTMLDGEETTNSESPD